MAIDLVLKFIINRSDMKIVLTGSLGNISKPVAHELVKKGHTVTVISSEDYYRNKPTIMGKVKMTDFAKEFTAAF